MIVESCVFEICESPGSVIRNNSDHRFFVSVRIGSKNMYLHSDHTIRLSTENNNTGVYTGYYEAYEEAELCIEQTLDEYQY
jgi:hypothetical protein